MSYLITQTFILLLLAGLFGLVLGWYLTRISAAGTRASLLARLKAAEADARGLRGELDAAVNARGACEAERKTVAEELGALKTRLADEAAVDVARFAALEAELAACRQALDGAVEAQPPAANTLPGSIADGDPTAPPIMVADDTEPDDLQKIKGIGPKIAGILKALGILRFEQIAAWTPENVAWVNEHLQFKGRIEREEWIPQARALLSARSGGK